MWQAKEAKMMQACVCYL